MFVCSHFAAHQERVDERNDNYNKIVRQLHFENTSKAAARMASHQQQQQQQQQQPGAEPVLIRDDSDLDAAAAAVVQSSAEGGGADAGAAVAQAIAEAAADDGHGPGMADAAMLVWAGDFNYRINGPYLAVVEAARAGRFAELYTMDQVSGKWICGWAGKERGRGQQGWGQRAGASSLSCLGFVRTVCTGRVTCCTGAGLRRSVHALLGGSSRRSTWQAWVSLARMAPALLPPALSPVLRSPLLSSLPMPLQCREQMEKGNVFRGLREPLPLGHPLFVPTYKFDKGEPVRPGRDGRLELPYDTSDKQRVPAWTDRIFYRGSRPGSLGACAWGLVFRRCAGRCVSRVTRLQAGCNLKVFPAMPMRPAAYYSRGAP